LAIAPIALAAVIGAFWRSQLARPWLFLAVGAAALYGAAAVALFIAVVIGPTFGGYFLEAPVQPGAPARSFALDSVDVGLLVGGVTFLAMAFGVLSCLKRWLSKP